mmetsp:Transcript_96665/g.144713  ORF Transcript_96665/g.144713 Transcript_96665/m.144713 type:complete len:397 (-) Transcript_96665:79-1269(-)
MALQGITLGKDLPVAPTYAKFIPITSIDLFSQNASWLEREKAFKTVVSPISLFKGPQAVQESIELISKTKEKLRVFGTILVSQHDHDALQRAIRLKNAAIHPDWERFYLSKGQSPLQAQIPKMFRYSAFYIANTCMVFSLLTNPGASLMGSGATRIFWTWVNQTYNIGLDFCNRSISLEDMNNITNGGVSSSAESFVKHTGSIYACTAFSACTMNYFVAEKLPTLLSPKSLIGNILRNPSFAFLPPTIACFGAHAITIYGSCYKNWKDGVNVFDSDGELVSIKNEFGEEETKSRKAGMIALNRNFGQRVVTLIAAMVTPTIGIALLDRTNFFRKLPFLRVPTHLGLVVLTLYSVLPWTISYYPQKLPVSTKNLEAPFSNLKNPDGSPRTLFINKGL